MSVTGVISISVCDVTRNRWHPPVGDFFEIPFQDIICAHLEQHYIVILTIAAATLAPGTECRSYRHLNMRHLTLKLL